MAYPEELLTLGDRFIRQPRNIRLPAHVDEIQRRRQAARESGNRANLEEWAYQIRPVLTRKRGLREVSPRVSVMIPAHNEQENILATLQSLALQEHIQGISMEVIVVDNNSAPDDLTAYLSELAGARVISYTWPKDVAPFAHIAFARQQALLAAARIKYNNQLHENDRSAATFGLTTDADTILDPNWVASMVDALSDPSVSFAYTSVRFHDPNLIGFTTEMIQHLQRMATQPGPISSLFPEIALEGSTTQSAGFRVQDALEVGGFDLRRQIREDITLARQLANLGRAKFIKGHSAWASARRFNNLNIRRLLTHGVAEASYGHSSSAGIVNVRD